MKKIKKDLNRNPKKEEVSFGMKHIFLRINVIILLFLLIIGQINCNKSEEKIENAEDFQINKIRNSIPANLDEIMKNSSIEPSILAALKYGSGSYNKEAERYEYQISNQDVVLALAKNSNSIHANENELSKDLDVKFSFTIINVHITKFYQKVNSGDSKIQFYLNMNVEVCAEDCSLHALNDTLCFSTGDYLKVFFSLNENGDVKFSEIKFSNPSREECNYIFVYSDGDR